MHHVRQQLEFCVLVSWTVRFHQESPATDQIAHGFPQFSKAAVVSSMFLRISPDNNTKTSDYLQLYNSTFTT